MADKKDYKGLLKTYKVYADNWLKAQSRIDTDYLLGLAYESAGATNVAVDKFGKTLERLAQLKGSPNEKEVRVNEYLPTTDAVNLKIALNHFENKEFQVAYQALDKIKNPLQLTEEEQILRIILASKLYEQKGDTESSIRYLSELVRLWNGSIDLALPVYVRLAEMQTKQNSVSDAMKTYKKCIEIVVKQEKPDGRLLKQIDRSYLNLLVKQNQPDEAINMLSQLIQKFDPAEKMAEEKYQLGLLQFKKGELKKASQTWETIVENDADIWKKLAKEKLQQASWDESYKKHLKRIPAMSSMEGPQ